jgi:hypothetical protein
MNTGMPLRAAGIVRGMAAAMVGCTIGGTATAITLGGGGDARVVDLSQKFDLQADRATAAKTYVTTAGGGTLAKMKRVAILNFCTQFVYSKEGGAASGSRSFTYSQLASGSIPLDAARMQKVADDFYDQVEAGFRSAGLEVVPYETLAANAAFQKFAKDYVQGPQEIEAGGKEDRDSLVVGRAVAISAKGRPFSTDCKVKNPGSIGGRVQLSYQLKDIYLVSVNAVVDFAKMNAKSGFLTGARASIENGEHLVPGDTQYHITGIMQPLYLNLWLKQAIVPAQSPFGATATVAEQTKKEVSLDEKQATRSESSAQQGAFDSNLYYENATSHLAALNDMMIATLKTK